MTFTEQTEQFEVLHPTDDRLEPVFLDLIREYTERYGDIPGHDSEAEVRGGSSEEFTLEQGGGFLVLLDQDTVIASGAVRRFDEHTVEFKRIWSHPERRGQRLATRMLTRLEEFSRELGYDLVYLTTGPRQPEADRLYLRSGYAAHYDAEAFTMHAYTKPLREGVPSILPTAAHTSMIDFNEFVDTRHQSGASV